MLFSSHIRQLIDEVEEKLLPLVQNVVLVGRRVNIPATSIPSLSLYDFDRTIDTAIVTSPLFSETTYVDSCGKYHLEFHRLQSGLVGGTGNSADFRRQGHFQRVGDASPDRSSDSRD